MTATQRRAFLLLMGVVFALCVWVVLPVWVPLFLGAMMAVTISPWYRPVAARSRHPRLLAAAYTGGALTVVLAVIAGIVYVIMREIVPLLQSAAVQLQHGSLAQLYSSTTGRTLRRVGLTDERMRQAATRAAAFVTSHAGEVVSHILSYTTAAVLAVFFTALTSYYLLVDGPVLLAWGERLSPLPREQTRSLYREFRDVVRGTLIGTGVTALFQGGVSIIGYRLLGVEHALMWGALTGIGSLVPGLGTALVWGPIGLILLAVGHTTRGVGVLVFGAVVIVGAADYLLRPLIVGHTVRLHSLLVFIAIFGGLESFGLIGLVLGPLLLALLVTILHIYDREYRPPKGGATPTPPPAPTVLKPT